MSQRSNTGESRLQRFVCSIFMRVALHLTRGTIIQLLISIARLTLLRPMRFTNQIKCVRIHTLVIHLPIQLNYSQCSLGKRMSEVTIICNTNSKLNFIQSSKLHRASFEQSWMHKYVFKRQANTYLNIITFRQCM